MYRCHPTDLYALLKGPQANMSVKTAIAIYKLYAKQLLQSMQSTENFNGIPPFLTGHVTLKLKAATIRALHAHGQIGYTDVCEIDGPRGPERRLEGTTAKPEV